MQTLRRHRQGSFRAQFLTSVIAAFCATIFISCSSRQAIAPGQIPAGEYVTPEDEAYGLQVLSALSRRYPVEQNDQLVLRVRDLVDKLAATAHADASPWNVYVLRGDDVVNAAATRGNFVFVWTGMLNTAYTDPELATVLSHELGHVLAHHTHATPEEEASQIFANISGNIASGVVSSQGPYGALAQLAGLLVTETIKALAVNPESQRQELEADHIGLFLMADAGFDPREAIGFWVRFGQQHSTPSDSMQFFSSHPATDERIVSLEALLPQALERYQRAVTPSATHRTPSPPHRPAHTPSTSSTSTVQPQDSFVLAPNSSPVEQTQTWVVIEPSVPIRSKPSDSAPVLQQLHQGDRVEVIEQLGRWFRVTSPMGGFVRGRDIMPKSLVPTP